MAPDPEQDADLKVRDRKTTLEQSDFCHIFLLEVTPFVSHMSKMLQCNPYYLLYIKWKVDSVVLSNSEFKNLADIT